MSRTNEITGAVDGIIRCHDEWERDHEAPLYVPAEFGNRVESAVEVINRGDIPPRCVKLSETVTQLRLQWDLYETGQATNSNGLPRSDFWKAYRQMLEARAGAIPVPPRRPEPVKVLLEQKVGYRQIAEFIYGHRGAGPFLDEDGQVRADLIEKEAKEPGSVIPTDWVHPSELERIQLQGERQRQELLAIDGKVGGEEQAEKHQRDQEQRRRERQQSLEKTAVDETQKRKRKRKMTDDKPADEDVVADAESLVIALHAADRDKDAAAIAEQVQQQTGSPLTVLQVTEILRNAKAAS